MTNFDIDSFNFITNCESDEEVIVVPSNIKGIRTFSFLDLPVKRIIFEGSSIEIEEKSFVHLEDLEILDMKNMDIDSLIKIENSLIETPLDICLIVNRDSLFIDLMEHTTFINIFVKDDVYDPDFGYNYARWMKYFSLKKFMNPKEVILVAEKENRKDSTFISGFYFPDYIDGKKVIINDLDSFSELFYNFNGIAISVKFPSLNIELVNLKNQSLKNIKRIHLSRLDEQIPVSFMDIGKLESLYIPKNIKVLNGFIRQESVLHFAFQDDKNIISINSRFLKDTPFMKDLRTKSISKNAYRSNDMFVWNDFAMNIEVINNEDLIIPNNIRVIADDFLSAHWSNRNRIKKLILGRDVEYIGNNSFDNCENIEEISFNEKLKVIGKHAFFNARMKRIKLPESIEVIGDYSFAGETFDSEEESDYKREFIDYPLTAKLGENCFEIQYETLPFN